MFSLLNVERKKVYLKNSQFRDEAASSSNPLFNCLPRGFTSYKGILIVFPKLVALNLNLDTQKQAEIMK